MDNDVQTHKHLKSFHYIKATWAPPQPRPGSIIPAGQIRSRFLECVFVSGSGLAIHGWWRAPSHKEAALKVDWSSHPCQSLRPQRQMKSCSSSIAFFVSQCSFFVLEGHQIQLAECLSFRGAGRTAFILLSFWPYIKAAELKGSTVARKPGSNITRNGCFLVDLCFIYCTTWMDASCVFVLTLKVFFLYSRSNFYSSYQHMNFCLWSHLLLPPDLHVQPFHLRLLLKSPPTSIFFIPSHL